MVVNIPLRLTFHLDPCLVAPKIWCAEGIAIMQALVSRKGSLSGLDLRGFWVLLAIAALTLGLLAGVVPTAADADPDGGPDTAFNMAIGEQLDGPVSSVAQQPNSKIVLGGEMLSPSSKVARFNSDGSADLAFNTNIGTSFGVEMTDNVEVVRTQADNKVLVGGWFSAPGNKLARLNADGTPDQAFNANVATAALDGWVGSIALQPNGKILVGGSFDSPSRGLARFNANGTPDTDFNANVGSTLAGWVASVAVQSDGKILVGGDFSGPSFRIARFKSDGSPDTDFNNVVAQPGARPNGGVLSIAVESSGKILAGGYFTAPGSHLARYLANGSPDTNFNANVASVPNDDVLDIQIQSPERIVVAGKFTAPQPYVAAFGSDGSADSDFNQRVSTLQLNGAARAALVDAEDGLLMAGQFSSPSARLARLNPLVQPDIIPPLDPPPIIDPPAQADPLPQIDPLPDPPVTPEIVAGVPAKVAKIKLKSNGKKGRYRLTIKAPRSDGGSPVTGYQWRGKVKAKVRGSKRTPQKTKLTKWKRIASEPGTGKVKTTIRKWRKLDPGNTVIIHAQAVNAIGGGAVTKRKFRVRAKGIR